MSEMENKEKTPSYRYIVSVKFANSKKAYNFGTNDETIVYGDKVVVETVRGMEIGEIISDLRDFTSVNITMEVKPVLRKATEKDMAANERNKADSPEAMKKCQQCIEKLGL